MRWEFHPGYYDAGLNIANFDRNVPRTGRVIIPSDPKAPSFIGQGVLTTINACPGPAINGVGCTPIVTAKEAGLPEGLRENYYKQFLPRLGLAYRLNEKTTLRASAGLYNMIILGSVFYSLTSTVQADVRSFTNVAADGKPVFFLPETRTPGSGVRAGAVGTFEFRTANQIDFHPPQMYQWSLSVDRQLSSSIGLRLSYIGNKSSHMPRGAGHQSAAVVHTVFLAAAAHRPPLPALGPDLLPGCGRQLPLPLLAGRAEPAAGQGTVVELRLHAG